MSIYIDGYFANGEDVKQVLALIYCLRIYHTHKCLRCEKSIEPTENVMKKMKLSCTGDGYIL